MSAARIKKISAKILLLMCAATASAVGRDVYVSSSGGDNSNDCLLYTSDAADEL